MGEKMALHLTVVGNVLELSVCMSLYLSLSL